MTKFPIFEYAMESLADELKEAGSPTNTSEAETLWRFLSSNRVSISKAKKLYLQAGYKPFSGFPLVRK